jgi:hypothetical protein
MPAQHPPRGGRAHPLLPTDTSHRRNTSATPHPDHLPPGTGHRPQSCPIPRRALGHQVASTCLSRRQFAAAARRRPPPAGKPAASGALAVAMRGRAAVFRSPPLLRASSTPPHNHDRPTGRYADPAARFPAPIIRVPASIGSCASLEDQSSEQGRGRPGSGRYMQR